VSRLARPFRLAPVVLAVAALTAFTSAACGYVNPPVMTMTMRCDANDSASATATTAVPTTPCGTPFFTMSYDDLQKKLSDTSSSDPTAGLASTTTTPPVSRDANQISTVLTNTARQQLVQQWVDELKLQTTDADKAAAQKASQSSGSQSSTPSDFQVQIAALERVLAEQAFASGKLDQNDQAHQLYDANKASYTTPAEVCFHVVLVQPDKDPTTGTSSPAQIQAAVDKAKAAHDRIGPETFEAVADSVNTGQLAQQYPGGNVGCLKQTDLGFSDADWAKLTAAPAGAVLDPMLVQNQAVFVFRVDSTKPEVTPTFDQVKDQVNQDLTYTVGQQLLQNSLEQRVGNLVVVVDPHYGVWDPSSLSVNPPEGAAQPTIPTTTTTTTPLSAPSTTGAPSTTTSTTAPAASTAGTPGSTTPGTTASSPGTTR
jgi:hypothetical protein